MKFENRKDWKPKKIKSDVNINKRSISKTDMKWIHRRRVCTHGTQRWVKLLHLMFQRRILPIFALDIVSCKWMKQGKCTSLNLPRSKSISLFMHNLRNFDLWLSNIGERIFWCYLVFTLCYSVDFVFRLTFCSRRIP